jgi:putative addiction module component (TIGR02574 family)
MPPTETLTVTIPHDVAERLRARVQAGIFSSESEAVTHSLIEDDDFSDIFPSVDPEEEEAWLQREIPKRLTELRSGKMKTIPLEDIMERFRARRAERISE